MSEDGIIAEILEAKKRKGNIELAIFRYSDGEWFAELGNPSPWVRLGESVGEIEVGPEPTMRAVLLKLKEKVCT